jgi:predicted regulator of Ras-like GTPase activity (Roadblock/LC7/MglB family)
METILQGLMELAGVRATMVLDGAGQVVAHRGHAVYDRAVCTAVGTAVRRAVESIQLQQEDWESLTAQFADGRILVRRVSARAAAQDARHLLAVVADATLNPSFATVALRVAANKVRALLEGGGSQASGSQPLPAGSQAAHAPAASSSVLPGADSRPNLANTGLSWTKGSSAGSQVGATGSGLSGVGAADPASAAFLARCAKELARHVGPISKVYVQEAVRRVCPEAPFSLASARPLVEDLSGQIEDPKDRAQFKKAALERK